MKSLRLLIVALGLVSWISRPPQAKASAYCDVYDGLPCSPAGNSLNCFWSTGERGYCFCEPVAGQPGFYWVCGVGKP
ncbi:MAG TPA: hypothetical protein VMW27_30120 [Thermoanaerobaculia bacterium]|nr:hypothetical protein [Thermoanaerobaculia bacterium]